MFTLLWRILPISLKISCYYWIFFQTKYKNLSIFSSGGYFFGKISIKKKKNAENWNFEIYIVFRSSSGAGGKFDLIGTHMLCSIDYPQSFASILSASPIHCFTWWNTRKIWKCAAFDVGSKVKFPVFSAFSSKSLVFTPEIARRQLGIFGDF
jgi:hypothetical protein